MAKNSYCRVKGSLHQCRTVKTRRWCSGEHSCLPSSWPVFDSRPTHLGGVPFLLESVTSSLSETCLPHGSKSFAVVQTDAEENTLSRLPLIIFAKILGKRTENVTLKPGGKFVFYDLPVSIFWSYFLRWIGVWIWRKHGLLTKGCWNGDGVRLVEAHCHAGAEAFEKRVLRACISRRPQISVDFIMISFSCSERSFSELRPSSEKF